MHKRARRRHVGDDRIFGKNVVKKGNSSSPVLSHVECYNYGNLEHKSVGYRNEKKLNASQHMHENAAAQVLKTRTNNGVERYTFVFSTRCQQTKVNRRGRNQKNYPYTLVANLSLRQKGSKWIWVRKYDVKEKVPLPIVQLRISLNKGKKGSGEKCFCQDSTIKGLEDGG